MIHLVIESLLLVVVGDDDDNALLVLVGTPLMEGDGTFVFDMMLFFANDSQ